MTTIPEDLPLDDTYYNPLVPEELVEKTVQSYFSFEITPEFLHTSTEYVPEQHAYVTPGMGTPIQATITKIEENNGEYVIQYESYLATLNSEVWRQAGKLVLRESTENEMGYIYVSHELIG